MFQEEYTKLWELIPYTNVHQYNQTYLYMRLNSYRDIDTSKM